jgi:hypothetical protein
MADAVGRTTTSFLPPIAIAIAIGLFLFAHGHRADQDRRLARVLLDDHDEVVRFR